MKLTKCLMGSALFMTGISCLPTSQPPKHPGNPQSPDEGSSYPPVEKLISLPPIPNGLKDCVFGYLRATIQPNSDGKRELNVKDWIDALDHCGAYEDRTRPQIDDSSPALRARWQIPELDAEEDDPRGGRGYMLSESRSVPAAAIIGGGGGGGGGGIINKKINNNNNNNLLNHWWTKIKTTIDDNISRVARSSTLNRFGSVIRQRLLDDEGRGFGNLNTGYDKMSGRPGWLPVPARMPLGFAY